MDLAAMLLRNVALDEGSSQAGVEDTAIDAASRLLGLVAGDFTGTSGGVRIDGSETEAERLAGLDPLSRGPGILHRTSGYGAVNPASSLIKAQRMAVHDNDAFGFFNAKRTPEGLGTWANQAAGTYIHPELVLRVPCAANVTTRIVALAAMEIRPGTTGSSVFGAIVINGRRGDEVNRNGGEHISTMIALHTEVVIPAGAEGTMVDVTCSARLRARPYQTANNKIGGANLYAVRIPV